MYVLWAFAFSALLAFGSGSEVTDENLVQYRQMIDKFNETATEVYKSLNSFFQSEIKTLKDQVETHMKVARSKRETGESTDFLQSLGDALNNFKDKVEKVYKNVTESDTFKDVSERVTKFGGDLQDATKKLGSQIESGFKNLTSSAGST